jgi:hypothetical protein
MKRIVQLQSSYLLLSSFLMLYLIALSSCATVSSLVAGYSNSLNPNMISNYNVSSDQLKGIQVYLGTLACDKLVFSKSSSTTNYQGNTNQGVGNFQMSNNITYSDIVIPGGTPGVIVDGSSQYKLYVDFGEGVIIPFVADNGRPLIYPACYVIASSTIELKGVNYSLVEQARPGTPVYFIKSDNKFENAGTTYQKNETVIKGKTVK